MNVYADHAATTPMRACAKEAMLEALEDFGNPSSIHSAGRLAAVRLESARKEVAELLNCRPSEIYFTSGGTEADNWAIRAARYGDGHVVAIEAVAASAWRVMTANRNVPPDAATGVILLSVQRGIQTAAGKSGHMNMEEIGLDRSGK